MYPVKCVIMYDTTVNPQNFVAPFFTECYMSFHVYFLYYGKVKYVILVCIGKTTSELFYFEEKG